MVLQLTTDNVKSVCHVHHVHPEQCNSFWFDLELKHLTSIWNLLPEGTTQPSNLETATVDICDIALSKTGTQEED